MSAGSGPVTFHPRARDASTAGTIFDGFFAAAEQTVFAGVRIDAANADPRIGDARLHERLVSAANDALHQRGIDALDGVEQSDMRRHVNDAQFRRDQHHRDFGSVGERRK